MWAVWELNVSKFPSISQRYQELAAVIRLLLERGTDRDLQDAGWQTVKAYGIYLAANSYPELSALLG